MVYYVYSKETNKPKGMVNMAKKPNLTPREKATMDTLKNSTNESVIEAVLELNQLQEDVSQLLDALYFMSLKKSAVDSNALTTLINQYAEQVQATNEAIIQATANKGKKIAKAVTVQVERVS